jgi:hypothetical protein
MGSRIGRFLLAALVMVSAADLGRSEARAMLMVTLQRTLGQVQVSNMRLSLT